MAAPSRCEAEEVLVLADLGLADPGPERPLGSGRLREPARREAGAGPHGLEVDALDPGVGERPPDDVADVFACADGMRTDLLKLLE